MICIYMQKIHDKTIISFHIQDLSEKYVESKSKSKQIILKSKP